MIKRRRGTTEVSVSFLDVISCGFGAIVLLLIIAPVGDPIALQEAERGLQQVVRELTEKLFDTRGEAVVLNEQLKSRKEQLSELEQRVAEIAVCFGVARLQCDGALVARHGLVELKGRAIRLAEIVVEERLVRRLLDRARDMRDRRGLVPGLVTDHTQQMTSVDLFGLDFQNALVPHPRFLESPLLVMRDRLLQQLCNRCVHEYCHRRTSQLVPASGPVPVFTRIGRIHRPPAPPTR